jgi:hypothetical protein
MFIVFQQENHYDGHIGCCYGPFATEEEADQFARAEEARPSNFNGDHRLHYYWVRELIKS